MLSTFTKLFLSLRVREKLLVALFLYNQLSSGVTRAPRYINALIKLEAKIEMMNNN